MGGWGPWYPALVFVVVTHSPLTGTGAYISCYFAVPYPTTCNLIHRSEQLEYAPCATALKDALAAILSTQV